MLHWLLSNIPNDWEKVRNISCYCSDEGCKIDGFLLVRFNEFSLKKSVATVSGLRYIAMVNNTELFFQVKQLEENVF